MGTVRKVFVIMPIKKAGTPEFQHFRTLYEEIIKPIVKGAAFEVERADDVQKTGAITRDIILRLAESDLVIADLTELNPNVFYELGIRHALRALGTILILDELRTSEIPFDLSAYRVVKFRGELEGIGKLRAELSSFLNNFDEKAPDRKDSPVHDWIPSLPINVIETASGSSEGKLREKVAVAEQKIKALEKELGHALPDGTAKARSPIETVMDALADAREGNLPSDLLQQAEEAARQQDKKGFLSIVRRLLEKKTTRLAITIFGRIAGLADNLGLDDVQEAVLTQALAIYPKNQELKRTHLSVLAHSDDPLDRQRARNELASEIGVQVSKEEVTVPDRLSDGQLSLFGVMLDAYYEDDLNGDALRIAAAFSKRFPDRTIVARNFARALETAGKDDESLEWFRKAVNCPDANDSSAVWLGSTLHNKERHVDAIEAYLKACLIDPDDATNFSHVADELSWAWRSSMKPAAASGRVGRQLPESVKPLECVPTAIQAAFSCALLDQDDLARCRKAARRGEIDITPFVQMVSGQTAMSDDAVAIPNGLSIGERIKFAESLYNLLRSPVTEELPKVL